MCLATALRPEPTKKNLVPHLYGQWNVRQIPMIRETRAYAQSPRVAELGILFGRPCWSVHRFGRVCPASDGSRSRPHDMDYGKPAFMTGAPRPALSSPREASWMG